ncbi:hypothetical protein [Longimicrobium sp.]|jgi:hypothetical protein|uniref:hypothetical protein n=1 Tax=Longimicrobium sp. TaxID=2029185 RepID=UPI002F93174A
MDPRSAELMAGIIAPRGDAETGARDASPSTSFSIRQIIEPRSPIVHLPTLPATERAAQPA